MVSKAVLKYLKGAPNKDAKHRVKRHLHKWLAESAEALVGLLRERDGSWSRVRGYVRVRGRVYRVEVEEVPMDPNDYAEIVRTIADICATDDEERAESEYLRILDECYSLEFFDSRSISEILRSVRERLGTE